MTDQLDLDRVKAPAKEPAKAWRNKWRMPVGSYTGSVCTHCGKRVFRAPGDVFDACCAVWPSREVAEAKAAGGIAEAQAAGKTPPDWLGAFPVDAA